MRQKKNRFPFSWENSVVIVILLTSLWLMVLGCTIEETCYDCDTIVLDEAGEIDCLIIECK
jgi:hypothetical protein